LKEKSLKLFVASINFSLPLHHNSFNIAMKVIWDLCCCKQTA